jgi:hypothetical protein
MPGLRFPQICHVLADEVRVPVTPSLASHSTKSSKDGRRVPHVLEVLENALEFASADTPKYVLNVIDVRRTSAS